MIVAMWTFERTGDGPALEASQLFEVNVKTMLTAELGCAFETFECVEWIGWSFGEVKLSISITVFVRGVEGIKIIILSEV